MKTRKEKQMTREYKKREKITAATFDFTMQKLQYQIEYQGKGKAPDKRFDKSTQGLCLFIQPNGSKTFYAVKSMEMFNKKKNRTFAPLQLPETMDLLMLHGVTGR